MRVPDWTVEEFMETAVGEAAFAMEERMDMALGEGFMEGDVSDKLDLLFEGLADIDEVAFYCARVAYIYREDIERGGVNIVSAVQGAVSQAICMGILLERARAAA